MSAEVWEYETEHVVDHHGADTFHHVVAGERHICETETEADARRIVQSVHIAARVESLAENCERKAAEDRAAVLAGDLTLGQIEGLERRAANYDLLVDGLRRVLSFPAEAAAS